MPVGRSTEVVHPKSATSHSPKEINILEALSDPKWDFRTIEGIARDTGLSKAEVKEVIERHPHLIRKSPITNGRKVSLYTLRERPAKLRERLANMQVFLTKLSR